SRTVYLSFGERPVRPPVRAERAPRSVSTPSLFLTARSLSSAADRLANTRPVWAMPSDRGSNGAGAPASGGRVAIACPPAEPPGVAGTRRVPWLLDGTRRVPATPGGAVSFRERAPARSVVGFGYRYYRRPGVGTEPRAGSAGRLP